MKRLVNSIIFLCIYTGGSLAADFSDLKGKWESQTGYGTVTLEFQTEMELVFDGDFANYTLVDDAIRVVEEIWYVDYPYTLENDVLMVWFPEGYQLEFTRVKEQTPPSGGNNAGKEAGSADLVQHFAGTWSHYTAYTEDHFTLMPDGRYYEQYIAAYGGDGSDFEGDWQAGGESRSAATWTIHGNKEKGVLIVLWQDGSTTDYHYEVFVEKGITYWSEYLFNGDLYAKQKE
ncbi:hypothetical protein JXB22_10020 [candidate division WOR-3 bacterium]|nr:hypothetical protein [candidate division WOR-3 bacterium]